MTKGNKKGFTLVEMVVVASLMVLIMGAILNFVQPINRFYQRTMYNSDANDIGSYIMDKFEAETRYSTNMLVLEGYRGVPAMSDGYTLNSAGAKSSKVAYTNVFIIDNAGLRGTQVSGYDANDTPAHRKRATGCLLTAPIDNGGIDMSKLQIVGSEDLYGDVSVNFTGTISTSDRNKCLTVGMEVFQPQFSGSSYVYTKRIFDQQRDFELVNLNLSDAGLRNMRADYFSDTRTGDGVAAIDYGKYTRASAPGGLPSGALDIYSGVNDYTFIFYTKNVTAAATTANVTLLNQSGGSQIDSETCTIGQPIPAATINRFMTVDGPSLTTCVLSGSVYHVHEFSGITSNGFGDLLNFETEPVMEDMEFYCIFNDYDIDASSVDTYEFYDVFDNTLNKIGTIGNPSTYTTLMSSGPILPSNNYKIASNGLPWGASVLEFKGWYTAIDANGGPAGSEFDPDAEYHSDMTFYAAYGPAIYLSFMTCTPEESPGYLTWGASKIFSQDASGMDIINSTSINSDLLAYQNALEAAYAPKKMKWYVERGDTNEVLGDLKDLPAGAFNVCDMYWVKPKLEDVPVGLAITACDFQGLTNGNQSAEYKIKIENNLTTEVKSFKFDITLPDNVDQLSTGDWRIDNTSMLSGSTVNVITNGDYANPGNCVVIPAGGSITINAKFNKWSGGGWDPSATYAIDYTTLTITDTTP